MPTTDPSILAGGSPGAIAVLRRFARRPDPREKCELCSAILAEDHEHLFELATRKLLCACGACAVLFSSAAAPRYRRVPRRIERLDAAPITDAQWAGLGVPINLAFFYRNTQLDQMSAVYPSPGGPIETPLAGEAWEALLADHPSLHDLAPEVEALLVHRMNEARDQYRVPIDECYKLVGLIRTHWRGLSGGTEVWRRVDEFFAGLAARASKARARA